MTDPADRSTGGDLQALLAALRDEDGVKRAEARERVVARGAEAVPALREMLTDERFHVRWEAAKALAEIAAPEAAPDLVRSLYDQEPDVRWLAAEALAAIGRPALVPLLGALVKDSDSIHMHEGIHRVGAETKDPEMKARLAPLREILDDPNRAPELVPTAHATLEAERAG